MRLGNGSALTPETWIEMLAQTPEEKSRWRLDELKKLK